MISVLYFVFLILPVFCEKPEIVDDIKPEVKRVNAIAYLNCTVVNLEEGETVNWSKLKTPSAKESVEISEDDRIVMENSEYKGKLEDLGLPKYGVIIEKKGLRKTFTLVVRYLQEEDAGQYRCYVKIQNVNYDKWPKKIGEIVVQVPPVIQTDSSSAPEMTVGGNLTLSCDAFGVPKPNITWKREDGGLLATGGFQYWGYKLVLKNIQKRDQGNYICVADNSVRPPASYTVQVMVFYAPTCRSVQNSVGQAQNRRFDAKLECMVEGHPEPSMQWEKIERGEKVEITDDTNYGTEKLSSTQNLLAHTWYTLLVKNVQADDYTDYLCVAKNKYGKCHARVKLFETMECQGPNCPSIGTGGTNQITAHISSLVFTVVCITVKYLAFL